MRVQRTYNVALVREVALQPDLWATISEDQSVTADDYYPDLESVFAIALINDDEELHGFTIGRYLTDTIADVHLLIHPNKWGHKDNVELGKLGYAALFVLMDVLKMTASVPVPDKQVLRYAQRIGFEREGVNKKSFRRNGEVLDQYYVGLTREKHEQSIRQFVRSRQG